jgi:hypothetical protein
MTTEISGDELARHHGHAPSGETRQSTEYHLERLHGAICALKCELPRDWKPRVLRLEVILADLAAAIREREAALRRQEVGGVCETSEGRARIR